MNSISFTPGWVDFWIKEYWKNLLPTITPGMTLWRRYKSGSSAMPNQRTVTFQALMLPTFSDYDGQRWQLFTGKCGATVIRPAWTRRSWIPWANTSRGNLREMLRETETSTLLLVWNRVPSRMLWCYSRLRGFSRRGKAGWQIRKPYAHTLSTRIHTMTI
jgi:hypothetical protein